MISMEEAIQIVLDHTPTIEVERIDFRDALGRGLASEVRSDLNMPPFDKSAMDGYAVVGADVCSVSKGHPVTLEVVEEIQAGAVPSQPVGRGQAAKIMTGAPVPKGADTVVMVEDTETKDGGASVEILYKTENGSNICLKGEDIQIGQVVLSPGTLLRPPEIGVLASVGAVDPEVYREPRVAVIPTGEEIVEASDPLQPGQIRNSNGPTMCAQISSAGATGGLPGHRGGQSGGADGQN